MAINLDNLVPVSHLVLVMSPTFLFFPFYYSLIPKSFPSNTWDCFFPSMNETLVANFHVHSFETPVGLIFNRFLIVTPSNSK